jgi:uncharacterized protein with HEPN domain
MRRDHVRLRDILEALDSLPRIIGGRTEPEFLADETVCYAQTPELRRQIAEILRTEFPE